MSDEPSFLTGDEVRIEPKRLLCPSHGEHLRAQWPKGYAIVGVRLFQKACENPELWAACGYVEGGEPPDPKLINSVTDLKPLCYFLSEDDLRAILREADIYRVRKCALCGLTGDVAPYSYNARGVIKTRPVCIECAMRAGRREHAAYPDGHNHERAERYGRMHGLRYEHG
jgi:hypothetical protein